MAEHGDLGLDSFVKTGLVAATGNQIGGKSQSTKITDRGLGGLGLLLTDGTDGRDQGDMDQSKVIVTDTELELTHGLNKRGRLDIADGTAELDDADIRLFTGIVHRDRSDTLHPVLDGIGDVGDHLDCLAEIITLALTFDDIAVDLAGGDVVGTSESHIQVTLIVAKVEVDLPAVVQNEDLT